MDLIAGLRSWALSRPRVLLVDAPGATVLRWALEAELDRRGWSRAVSPADTDLLVVLGDPGEELSSAVDVLWSQVPEPRQRIHLHHDDDVIAALAAGRDALIRRANSDIGSDDRPSPSSLLGEIEAGHEGMDHGGGSEGMDHGGGSEGMDHGGGSEGHDMHHGGEVAGLPMAMTAPDRDGLELDVLKVTLGPVLPGWPTGLVLRADLRGDVVTSAELSWVDAERVPPAEPRLDPQRRALDRLARFLEVAGWPTASRDARHARDDSGADGSAPGEAQRLAEAVARRVCRSRMLSWTAGGIGQAPSERSSGGSVLDRVRRWCDAASGRPVDELPAASLDDVAALLEGAEIGSARLIVASLDLSPVPVVPASEHAHA